ncbi:MAG: Sec-independent protein translocase protein TatB [Halieaceae bacterium]|nr:Sec-independent protein translocase protein TatB [Halieaceae bacterium]
MFDIGFLELIIVSIVGLLVLGPERLPGAIRTVMAYVNKIRRSFAGIRAEIERELQAEEFKADLHNQGIMEELKQAEKALRSGLNTDGVKLGKDGYPIDEPYVEPAPEDSDSRHADAADEQEFAPEPTAEDPDSRHADAADDQFEPGDETRAAKP